MRPAAQSMLFEATALAVMVVATAPMCFFTMSNMLRFITVQAKSFPVLAKVVAVMKQINCARVRRRRRASE